MRAIEYEHPLSHPCEMDYKILSILQQSSSFVAVIPELEFNWYTTLGDSALDEGIMERRAHCCSGLLLLAFHLAAERDVHSAEGRRMHALIHRTSSMR